MKNRFVIAAAVLSYLVFYFISPYFHFHNDDHFLGTSQKYHSHWFNNTSASETDGSVQHAFENENNHSHAHVINAITTTYSKRILQNQFSIITYAEYNYASIENSTDNTNPLLKFSINKYRWEKCVHTASNVSPPSNLIS
ncbi:MAG: hypothetical protein AB1432_05350 [Bacteroidota bacterium]|jgi:hypothetical protein